MIFKEFSVLQKEYNTILIDFQKQESIRFKLEETLRNTERKLMVNKKQNLTAMELLQEKERIITEFENAGNFT